MSDIFRTDSGIRQGCVVSPWLFNLCVDGVMKEGKMGWEKGTENFRLEERMEIAWPLVCR